jgi:hypothetical protein
MLLSSSAFTEVKNSKAKVELTLLTPLNEKKEYVFYEQNKSQFLKIDIKDSFCYIDFKEDIAVLTCDYDTNAKSKKDGYVIQAVAVAKCDGSTSSIGFLVGKKDAKKNWPLYKFFLTCSR